MYNLNTYFIHAKMKSAAVIDLFFCFFYEFAGLLMSRVRAKSIVYHQTSMAPNMECVYSLYCSIGLF